MAKGEPNERLRNARQERGWSQLQLASKMRVTLRTVGRWETGETIPFAKQREELRNIFGMDEVGLGFGRQAEKGPDVFNVPYRRNEYFTGREDMLMNLGDALRASTKTGLPVALCGLGGIGKTQLAIEYAYEYAREYRYILWTEANSYTQLVSGMLIIADLLNLPEKDKHNQSKVLHAVKRWFDQNMHWLLILDDVEDLDMISPFLPSNANGHIVLMTRTQLVGTRATRMNIEKMDVEEGATLLLRCAKKIDSIASLDQASTRDQKQACRLAKEMDGLPLALDQAGAYMYSEGHQDAVARYLSLYLKRRADLLRIRGKTGNDHPLPVTTTFLLAFDRISEFHPAAAACLQFCAYLSAESIPENLITDAPDLGSDLQPIVADPIQFHDVIEALLTYSLIHRLVNRRAFTMHRLVQAVLQDRMNEEKKRLWIYRVIRAVDRAYEAVGSGMIRADEWYTIIQHTMQYDPHAQECAKLIKQWKVEETEAFFLLYTAGNSLRERGLYTSAEPLLQQAITIGERFVGQEQLILSNCIASLASLYQQQGKFDQAESLFKQSLSINEHVLETRHAMIASSLNNLGQFYIHVGDYEQAEHVYRQALKVPEGDLKPEYSDNPAILHNLALLSMKQGKYNLAFQFNQRAQTLRANESGDLNDTKDIAGLINMVLLEVRQGHYDLALSHCQEALAMLDAAHIPEVHPTRVFLLDRLAGIYLHQKKDAEAEELYHSVLRLHKKMLGEVHPDVAVTLANLAKLYTFQMKYEEAAQLYRQALTIFKEVWGPQHNKVIELLVDLAELYKRQGKYSQAQPLYQDTLIAVKNTHGVENEIMVYILVAYVSFLEEIGEQTEAEQYNEALKIFNPELVKACRVMQRRAFER